MQALYETHREKGFSVLAFPCNQFANQEPLHDSEVQQFCQTNYKVTFPVFAKVDVNGASAHPLYSYLVKEAPGILGGAIKWNFTKFLINREGRVIKRFASMTTPAAIESAIPALL